MVFTFLQLMVIQGGRWLMLPSFRTCSLRLCLLCYHCCTVTQTAGTWSFVFNYTMQELFVCFCSVLNWTKNVHLQYLCKMSVMVEMSLKFLYIKKKTKLRVPCKRTVFRILEAFQVTDSLLDNRDDNIMFYPKRNHTAYCLITVTRHRVSSHGKFQL